MEDAGRRKYFILKSTTSNGTYGKIRKIFIFFNNQIPLHKYQVIEN